MTRLNKLVKELKEKTLDEYKKSAGLIQHGAYLFKGCKIYSYGFNNHCKSCSFYPSLAEHAESSVISSYYRKYKKFFLRIATGKMKFTEKRRDLIVIRVNKTGELCNSKCCASCISIMRAFNIENVFYTNEMGELVKEKINDFSCTYVSSGGDSIIKSKRIMMRGDNVLFLLLAVDN